MCSHILTTTMSSSERPDSKFRISWQARFQTFFLISFSTRLIAPPLPQASQPAMTTQTGGPNLPEPIWPPKVSLSAASLSCCRLSFFRPSFLP